MSDESKKIMKKPLLTPSGALFVLAVSNTLAAIICGVINLLYSLEVEGEFAVSHPTALIASATAIAIYISSSLLTLLFGDRSESAFGIAFWGVTLCGFAFYAAFNIFEIPIVVPMINMTAFLRLMMTLLTLPILAYNAIISALPTAALSFIAALTVPAASFTLHLYRFIKSIRETKK